MGVSNFGQKDKGVALSWRRHIYFSYKIYFLGNVLRAWPLKYKILSSQDFKNHLQTRSNLHEKGTSFVQLVVDDPVYSM